MLKATVQRRPTFLAPLHRLLHPRTASSIPSDLSFSIRFHAPIPPPQTASSTVGNSSRSGFPFEHQFRFLPCFLSFQPLCCQVIHSYYFNVRPGCYGIQRTAIYEFGRKHDDYASHRRVSLYRGEVKASERERERRAMGRGWLGRNKSKEEGEQEVYYYYTIRDHQLPSV